MEFSMFTGYLIKTALRRFVPVIIWAVPAFVLEYTYTHSKKKLTKAQNKDRRQLNDLAIAMLVIRIIVFLIEAVPIFEDCISQNYVSIHGEYTLEHAPATKGNPEMEWVVIITDDGSEISLHYPRGKDLSTLPDEGCYGTVWYSENSHYILEFIPDEATDDN